MIGERLVKGWEFSRGGPGTAWEVWRRDQWKTQHDVPWTPVTMPHCYNAEDAVDPGTAYYQGPAWYRTRLDAAL